MDRSENLDMERLNRVATRQTVRLTHYDRKSGRAYEVPIWFAVDGDRVYLETANVNRQWVRNVQKTPRLGCRLEAKRLREKPAFLPIAPSTNAQR